MTICPSAAVRTSTVYLAFLNEARWWGGTKLKKLEGKKIEEDKLRGSSHLPWYCSNTYPVYSWLTVWYSYWYASGLIGQQEELLCRDLCFRSYWLEKNRQCRDKVSDFGHSGFRDRCWVRQASTRPMISHKELPTPTETTACCCSRNQLVGDRDNNGQIALSNTDCSVSPSPKFQVFEYVHPPQYTHIATLTQLFPPLISLSVGIQSSVERLWIYLRWW